MKNQVVKRMKKVLATILAVSMLAGLSMVASARTYDETEVTGILYSESYNYTEYMADQKAPEGPVGEEGTGYLFAGWYDKVVESGNTVYKVLRSVDDAQKATKVVAKFIPANLLSVKCQALANTSLDSPTTSLKVFTGLDSLNYKNVGFDVYAVTVSEDGKTWTAENHTGDVNATVVYNTLKVSGFEEPLTAADAFGEGIGAKYFATTWIKDIASTNYERIISVKPYLTTLDGTKVEGLEKYIHVVDAYEIAGEEGYRWVNIPINVRDTEGVAAGVLKLTNNNGWDCVEVECGRLFQEMDYAIKEGKDVKLVGNLSSMTADAQEAKNAIYANVRLKVHKDAIDAGNNFYNFVVSEVDFADIAEQQFSADNGYTVWNVAHSIMR